MLGKLTGDAQSQLAGAEAAGTKRPIRPIEAAIECSGTLCIDAAALSNRLESLRQRLYEGASQTENKEKIIDADRGVHLDQPELIQLQLNLDRIGQGLSNMEMNISGLEAL